MFAATLRCTAAGVVATLALSAQAQMSPVGTWQTIDEKTNAPRSTVIVTEAGGVVSGRIDKLLRPGADQNAKCDECTDDRKGRPVVGLEIIRGAKKADGRDVWESGTILDPENGKAYTLRMTPIEGGRKLEVRGSIGPFGRTQTWTRLQ